METQIKCNFCYEKIPSISTTCPKCGAPIDKLSKRDASNPKVGLYLSINGRKLPEAQLPYIRERMLQMSPERIDTINLVKLKDPTAIFIISVLVGCLGVDRFILEEDGLGVAKLLTCGGAGVWAIIDIFTAAERTRKHNLKKIQSYF